MTTLNAADEEAELIQSRSVLEAIIGAPVLHFAPPGGRWSGRTRGALKRAGYVAVSSSRYGFNHAARETFAYSRLPVVRATPLHTFEAMVRADRNRLWTGYVRAAILGAARRVLGESVYGHARELGKGH